MSSYNLRSSLKEVMNKRVNQTKLFFTKLQHRRNQSISVVTSPSKKILSKKGESTKILKPKNSLFNVSQNKLDQISSYGTKEKIGDSNKDTKPKEVKEEKKIKAKRGRTKAKSQKNLLSIDNSIEVIKDNEDNNKKKNKDKDVIIFYNRTESNDIPDNFITIPKKLNAQLQKPELFVVSPNRNIEGNYSYYINGVADSLREFIEFDYDSIYDEKNQDNIKYLYYTTPMDIDDIPKKKLLLIDLDETLIHSEFRSKDNYKALDLYIKNSKCQTRTFSYSDENYIYFIDVFFRPHLQPFLQEVAKYFDLAIFTAATKTYADIILDYIDPKNEFFQFRLYRDACIPIQQRLYIKDLRIIKDYDPRNVILMDNSLYSFMNQPSNGMLVNSFYTNNNDTQLISAKNFLINHILPCDDIRQECEKWYHFTDLLYKGTSKEKKEE